MRNLLLLLLVLSADVALCAESTATSAQTTNTVAFYFGAHPDDWQLFMNPNAWHDVQKPSNKVVFVYVTAGDAGLGLGNGARSQPYYLARENGARLSVRFLADAAKPPEIPVDSIALVSGHPIKRWLYRNTVSYFMRLPDGSPPGTGYVATAEQSLKRLHEGVIRTMTTIDNSTTYQGWSDFRTTLRKLIDHERGTATNVWVNIPDTNIEKNVGDHTDHQHMGPYVFATFTGRTSICRTNFIGRRTAQLRRSRCRSVVMEYYTAAPMTFESIEVTGRGPSPVLSSHRKSSRDPLLSYSPAVAERRSQSKCRTRRRCISRM